MCINDSRKVRLTTLLPMPENQYRQRGSYAHWFTNIIIDVIIPLSVEKVYDGFEG